MMKYSIYTSDLSGPLSQQDTSHIYWFDPPKQLARKKQRTHIWDSTLNKLCRTALAYVHRTEG